MKFFKKADLIVIAVLLAASAAGFAAYRFFYVKASPKAEIYYDSSLVQTVDLGAGADKRFSIPQNKNVVFHVTSDGKIRFEESDCPDKICIRTGWIGTVGESAACLPNRIIVKIVPGSGERSAEDIDLVAG